MPGKNKKNFPKLDEALYLNTQGLSSMKAIMETVMLITLATKKEIEEQKITDQNSVIVKRLKELEKFAALSQELWIEFSNKKPVAPQKLLEWCNQANRFGDLVNPQHNQVAAHNRVFKLLEAQFKQKGVPVPKEILDKKAAAPTAILNDAQKHLLKQLQSVEVHARVILKNSAPKHKTLWQKFSNACKKITSNTISSVKSLFSKKKQAKVQEPAKKAEKRVLLFSSGFNPTQELEKLKKTPTKTKATEENPLAEEIEAARKNLNKSPSPANSEEELDALFAEITPRVTIETAFKKIQAIITGLKANDFLKTETFKSLQKQILETIKGEQNPGERASVLPMNKEDVPKLLEEIENSILSKVRIGKIYNNNRANIHDNLEKLSKDVAAAHAKLTQGTSVIDQPIPDFFADIEAEVGVKKDSPAPSRQERTLALLDKLKNLDTPKQPMSTLENALFLIDLEIDSLLDKMPERGKLTEEKIKSLLETVKKNLYNKLNADGTVNGLLNEADFKKLKVHLKERLKNEPIEQTKNLLADIKIEYLLMSQGVSLTAETAVAPPRTSSQPSNEGSDPLEALLKNLEAEENPRASQGAIRFSQSRTVRTSSPKQEIPRLDYESCKNTIINALKKPTPDDYEFKFTKKIQNTIYTSLANIYDSKSDVLVKRTLSPKDFDKLKSEIKEFFMRHISDEISLIDLPQIQEMIKIMNFIDTLSKKLPEEENKAMQKFTNTPPTQPRSDEPSTSPRPRPDSGKF